MNKSLHMNSISFEQIEQLTGDGRKLTELLIRLLFSEHKKYNFENCTISVPQNINSKDGGEDGKIVTTDFKGSEYIKDKECLFQCKASKMEPKDCYNEVLQKNGELKPRVKNVVDNNGAYILVTTQGLTTDKIDDDSERVKSIRKAIKEGKIKEGVNVSKAEQISKNAKIKIFDANILCGWTNNYISVVSYVQKTIGVTKPFGILTWDEFKSYESNQERFRSNDIIDEIIEKIREDLYCGRNIRVEGVSGIGKTRLICEVLSPGMRSSLGEYNVREKSNSVNSIYVNLNSGYNEILSFVKSHALDMQAILVLDNCPPNIHREFILESKRSGSRIQIVSIDFDKLPSNPLMDEKIIELKSEYYKSITEEILKDNYRNLLSSKDIEFLIDFSEGNVKLAIDFAATSLKKINLNETFDDELVKKLVFGREEVNDFEFNVLKIIASFKTFEHPSDEVFQINEELYNKLFNCTNFISDYLGASSDSVNNTIKKFIRKGNLERRGNLIMVRPNPLALKLSLLFWDSLPITKYSDFIERIPETLKIALCEQLQNIGSVSKAKELVQTIWGMDGNFSTAEILNSNMGSRLFRSIVTVNPEESTKVLVNRYLGLSKHELEQVTDGRQNIVWALEKLCFRKETFFDAARVLMSFAAAEIETYYSNNATSYFLQLFKIVLAGTEVDYEERLKVLQWGLAKNQADFIELALKACKVALSDYTHSHRILGAELQGGELPLKEFYPNQNQIQGYFNRIIEISKDFFNSENEIFKELSQQSIYTNILILDEFDYENKRLQNHLTEITNNAHNPAEVKKTLLRTLTFKKLSDTKKKIIKEQIIYFNPVTLEDKLKQYVIEPEYSPEFENEIDVNKKYEERAIQFAVEIYNSNIDISEYLDLLLTGVQFQTYNFGKKYGNLAGYNESLIHRIVQFLSEQKHNNWNISFFNGYLSSLNSNEVQNIFNLFLEEKSIFSFIVFRQLKPNLPNALNLLPLLAEEVDLAFLRQSKYEISKLPPKDLRTFLIELEKIPESIPYIISIISEVIRNYRGKADESLKLIGNYLVDLSSKYNLLQLIFGTSRIDLYEWEEVMKALLSFKHETAKNIASDIVAFYLENFPNVREEYHIANIANATLKCDFHGAWSEYSQLLLENGQLLIFFEIFNLNWLMGAENSNPFFEDENQNQQIFDWLLNNRNVAKNLIRISPLYSTSGEWFRFTKNLIDEFGEEDGFLVELSCNMHSMSTWGSRVPFLKSRKNLLEILRSHRLTVVSSWASEEIARIEKEIKLEKLRDEEYGLKM